MHFFIFLEDGTSSVTCSVPNPILETLVKQLVEKRTWDKLHVLYLGGGGPQRYAPGEGGLATGIDASGIPIELVMDAGDKYRVPLIGALLENGACSDGLGKREKSPIEQAVENEDYNMVVTLLQHSANPACLVTKTGDSLLHEALKQTFATGRFSVFLHCLYFAGVLCYLWQEVQDTSMQIKKAKSCWKMSA